MAKEFDIFLKSRVTECDLIVSSIPYRDGLTVTNRLVLESCLKAYSLQKMIAVQVDSKLVSHIDKMIKICYEKLNWGTDIDANASFQTHYILSPEDTAVNLTAEDIDVLETSFMGAQTAMVINAAPLSAKIAKSFGQGRSSVTINDSVQGTLKRGIMSPTDRVVVNASVLGSSKTDHIEIDAPVTSDAKLLDLFYKITATTGTAMEIAALVLGTEFHYSFGLGYTGLSIGTKLLGVSEQIYEVAKTNLQILSKVVTLTEQYMTSGSSDIVTEASADSIIKRHRLLSELDPVVLSELDDMVLGAIDYVII